MRGYTSEIKKKRLKCWYMQQYNESKYLGWVKESMQRSQVVWKFTLTVPEIIAVIIWLSGEDMRISVCDWHAH